MQYLGPMRLLSLNLREECFTAYAIFPVFLLGYCKAHTPQYVSIFDPYTFPPGKSSCSNLML